MEAWAARPAPCDPRVGADQRPVTISACCPAASAGLPVVTSFPCGGGPGCPHDQGTRDQQPEGGQREQVAGGAGERQGAGAGDGGTQRSEAGDRAVGATGPWGQPKGSRGSRRSRSTTQACRRR